jgi:hypothetical protein
LAGLIDERACDANRHFGGFVTVVENALKRQADERNLPPVVGRTAVRRAAIGEEARLVGVCVEA